MRRGFLILAVVGVCLAQTPTPPAAISAYYRLAGNVTNTFPYQWLIIDAPLSLSFDGKSPHLSVPVPAPVKLPVYGFGFNVASSPGQPDSINLDTSFVAFRVPAPTGPGPCVDPISGMEYGTGAWAVSRGSDPDPLSPINGQVTFYVCVESLDRTHFVWTPMMTYQSNWLVGN